MDSFEKLEITIHLYRGRFRAQNAAEIAEAMELPHDATAEALVGLTQATVLRTDGTGWWFDPNGPWAANVEQLVLSYDDDRLDVVNLMGRLAVERIRAQAAKLFADAFVLGKPKKKGEPDA